MPTKATTVVVWLETHQAALAREVAAAAEFTIVGAGSPSRGQSGAVAAELKCKLVDDLRATLASGSVGGGADRDVDMVWILSPGEFGLDQSGNDVRAILQARARGVRIASLEPIPPTALDLAGSGWAEAQGTPRPADAIRFCPLARFARPYREAAEVLREIGNVRAAAIESWCAPHEGSLGAGLFSAMELLHSVFGEPESIDAAYVGPKHIPGVHPLPGETLRDLHGDLTANLRFSTGRAAALAVSNQAGRWNRTTTLIGDGGRLRVYDDGFEWIGPDGKKMDEMRTKARGTKAAGHAVEALADALSRLSDQAVPDAGPSDLGAVLAMGQAALLSARTGQPESPATVRRMAGVP